MVDFNVVTQNASKHPKPNITFMYGTAGFRNKSEVLDSVMFRMGLLAVLRSKYKNGQAIGIMVTASHNPVQDNGVKLVDPYGEMLEQSWETFATRLAQSEDSNVARCVQNIIEETGVNIDTKASVVVGMDTRPSSVGLLNSVKEGVESLGGECKDFGLLTTPQLHYLVCCINTNGRYGEPTELGYYQKYSSAFEKLHNLIGPTLKCEPIKLDGANGVGGIKIKELIKHMNDLLPIEVFNDGTGSGILNVGCGADFVKSNQKAPSGVEMQLNDKCAAFDGDADRIVYFFKNSDGEFKLLDGDRIASWITSFIKEKLDFVGIKLEKGLGVVQTAYANGSSTEYLKDKMGVPVAISKTGVKHLHHSALQYDIGVYFEANGHGTIIYSEEAQKKIKSPGSNLSDDQKKAAEILSAFLDLTNQTVGDAISDMLLVEIVLLERQATCADWYKEYVDLPNKLSKVSVKDRRVITTNSDETRVVEPQQLQQKIDEAVSKVSHARSFVRPSGTEDVVRVYAEAETPELTDRLSAYVTRAVYDICDGVGERPTAEEL